MTGSLSKNRLYSFCLLPTAYCLLPIACSLPHPRIARPLQPLLPVRLCPAEAAVAERFARHPPQQPLRPLVGGLRLLRLPERDVRVDDLHVRRERRGVVLVSERRVAI